jgi:predicted transport protein
MDHCSEFERLVRERLGGRAASQVMWSGPRVVCIAGGFTRYDVLAVREHRRSIDLVRYRLFGDNLFGLETVASVRGRQSKGKPVRPLRARQAAPGDGRIAELEELADAVDEVLLGLGDAVSRVQRKQYLAYQRLRNFACVCPSQKTKLLVYLAADPKTVDLVPGLTRDVTGLGHHGTGDLEVQLRTERDLERAHGLFQASYAAA